MQPTRLAYVAALCFSLADAFLHRVRDDQRNVSAAQPGPQRHMNLNLEGNESSTDQVVFAGRRWFQPMAKNVKCPGPMREFTPKKLTLHGCYAETWNYKYFAVQYKPYKCFGLPADLDLCDCNRQGPMDVYETCWGTKNPCDRAEDWGPFDFNTCEASKTKPPPPPETTEEITQPPPPPPTTTTTTTTTTPIPHWKSRSGAASFSSGTLLLARALAFAAAGQMAAGAFSMAAGAPSSF